MKIEFCLPIYNEEKILKNNLLKLLKFCEQQNFPFSWKIIAVVNGSSDKSEIIANRLSAEHAGKISCTNFKEGGRGRALKKYWLQSQADILCYMDADLAVSLDDIPKLLAPLISKEADLCVGSRLLPQSKIKRSIVREIISQSYNLLSRLILQHNFSDLQCGFKGIKKEVFQKIAPFIDSNYWFFDTEIIFYVKNNNFKIKEIPVNWSENRYDKRKSKVSLIKDSVKFFTNLVKLRIKNLNKKKLSH